MMLKPGLLEEDVQTHSNEKAHFSSSLSEPDVSTDHRLKCAKVIGFFQTYVFGTAEGLRKWCSSGGDLWHLKYFVIASNFFRGVGQVVFMDNPWTGLIMFICLLSFHFYYALLGMIGGLTNYTTAVILLGTDYLHLPTSNYLNNGIFVYNGLLIGLVSGTFVNELITDINTLDSGILLFLKLIPFCIMFSYICTSIHVSMTNVFPSFPVFTFPFNFAAFLYLAVSIQITWMNPTLTPYLATDNDTNSIYEHEEIPFAVCTNVYVLCILLYTLHIAQDVFFKGIFRGPAQIYLCSDEYIGIIFLFSIALCNWKASLLALCGSAVGTLFSVLIGIDLERISLGLHSFNSCLTMMGVGCIFSTLNRYNFMMAMLHSMLCVLIELALMTMMAPSGIPYLTLPFCLSTMFFSVFAYRQKQENKGQDGKTKHVQKKASIRGAPTKLDIANGGGNNEYKTVISRRGLSPRGTMSYDTFSAPY